MAARTHKKRDRNDTDQSIQSSFYCIMYEKYISNTIMNLYLKYVKIFIMPTNAFDKYVIQ